MLFQITNKCWESGEFPKIRNEGVAIMLPKPNKDPTKLENHRYIPLIPVMWKVYERLIKNRINWIVKTKKILPPFQYGFSKGLNTPKDLALLERDVLYSLQNYEIMITVFVDIMSAFDVVSNRQILEGLISLGIKGPLISVRHDYLREKNCPS